MSGAPITSGLLARYGMIALPLAFAGFPLYVLAPDFYATHHGLSLGVLGVILLVVRLLDAVQDPVIGWMVDKYRTYSKYFVFSAAACLCVSIALLFNVVFIAPALWFAVCMFFSVTAYSIITIILGAEATLWTKDRHDQTRIAGARESFGLVGLIIAVTMPSLLQHMVPSGEVYIWYSVILSVLMLLGLYAFSKTPASIKGKYQGALVLSPALALRQLPCDTLRLFTVHGVSMVASSIPAVLVIFFVRDLLGAEHLVGLFLLLYFMAGILGMPLWRKISFHIGRAKAWALSNTLAVIGFIGAFFLGSGDVAAYAAVCIISGVALGADLTLPPAMLSGQIHAQGHQHLSATHYAFLAFIAKVSLALASAVALPYLDYAGFTPQGDNGSDALFALSLAYALIPCALKLLAAAMLYLFFVKSPIGGNNETL